MVPLSNVMEGLWFWSKKERTDALNVDHLKKERGVQCLHFNWRRYGHHMCVYCIQYVCAGMQVSFNFRNILAKIPLLS